MNNLLIRKYLHPLLALGVGGKAISSNVSTTAESDGSSTAMGRPPFKRSLQAKRMQVPQVSEGSSAGNTGSASETAVSGSSRNSYTLPQQSTSALKSIMEQGTCIVTFKIVFLESFVC